MSVCASNSCFGISENKKDKEVIVSLKDKIVTFILNNIKYISTLL